MIFDQHTVNRMLESAGLSPRASDIRFRVDAGETAAFTRQLQYVETQIYLVEYPDNRARDFIPVDGEIGNWAQSYVWRLWDWAGMADIVTSASDDLPAVDIMASETIQGIQTLGASFGYTFQDLVTAAKLAMPLDTEKGELARRAVENKIEALSVFGDVASKLPGFTNMPNVPILSPPGQLTGGWLTGASSEQILDDMHAMADAVVINTKTTHKPDTLLLPLRHYSYVSRKRLNTFTDATILSVFLKTNAYIRNVDQWNYLANADGSGGPLAICYQRNPRVVKLVIPEEFKMAPPQPTNLAFKVPCSARYGGVSWRYPLAAVYAVGI